MSVNEVIKSQNNLFKEVISVYLNDITPKFWPDLGVFLWAKIYY